jgi:hypothetical protein
MHVESDTDESPLLNRISDSLVVDQASASNIHKPTTPFHMLQSLFDNEFLPIGGCGRGEDYAIADSKHGIETGEELGFDFGFLRGRFAYHIVVLDLHAEGAVGFLRDFEPDVPEPY